MSRAYGFLMEEKLRWLCPLTNAVAKGIFWGRSVQVSLAELDDCLTNAKVKPDGHAKSSIASLNELHIHQIEMCKYLKGKYKSGSLSQRQCIKILHEARERADRQQEILEQMPERQVAALFKGVDAVPEPEGQIHEGVTCDVCEPLHEHCNWIVGTRYACNDCYETRGYDLCAHHYECASTLHGQHDSWSRVKHRKSTYQIVTQTRMEIAEELLGYIATNAAEGRTTDLTLEELNDFLSGEGMAPDGGAISAITLLFELESRLTKDVQAYMYYEACLPEDAPNEVLLRDMTELQLLPLFGGVPEETSDDDSEPDSSESICLSDRQTVNTSAHGSEGVEDHLVRVFCQSAGRWVDGQVVEFLKSNLAHVEFQVDGNRCMKVMPLDSDDLIAPHREHIDEIALKKANQGPCRSESVRSYSR